MPNLSTIKSIHIEEGRIEFQNANYAYDEKQRSSRKESISKVNPGETVAIVGATGVQENLPLFS